MIYFDIRLHPTQGNTQTSTVSIRKMTEGVYAYEINRLHDSKVHRGTVTHEGPEDFKLITAVFNDYVEHHERLTAS